VLTITNDPGLHARPASLFVKEASRFRSSIFISKDGLEVNGKSIMGILMLAAGTGSEVKLRAEGPDEAEAIEALAALVGSGFEDDRPAG
jgi:phosphocarrier protein